MENLTEMQYTELAMKKALDHHHEKFDLVCWSMVTNKDTPCAMATALRLNSHKAVITMEKMYYRHPEYVVQWICDNEALALKLEECTTIFQALDMIKKHRGI
jgi:hypothetical protein